LGEKNNNNVDKNNGSVIEKFSLVIVVIYGKKQRIIVEIVST
jgi:hypothetical protein